MIQFFKIYIWIILPFLLLIHSKTNQDSLQTKVHEVAIKHPGETEPVDAVLNEIKNSAGLTIEYKMDVFSVICLEGVCKVIPVALYWNPVGAFKKYELAEGATLEKYEDAVFAPEDYSKLQNILSNENSPFKDVYYDDILTAPVEHGNEEVDALSGATALVLDDKDTVPGAALTCFTLWHWANGEVVALIKSFTGASATNSQLKNFVLNKDTAYFRIAITELQNRKLYTRTYIDPVIQKTLSEPSLLNISYSYIKDLPDEAFFYSSKKMFLDGGKPQKLAAIQWLLGTSKKMPAGYLNDLVLEINQLKSYQETTLFLDLMSEKNSNSQTVITYVFSLLDSDILIARRAYWFLKSQKLDEDQKVILESFYIRNEKGL